MAEDPTSLGQPPQINQINPLEGSEKVSRFITASKWVRLDQTIKSDAFLPAPLADVSVTRNRNLSSTQLWQIGQDIANGRKPTPAKLYGRAEITVEKVRKQKLDVEAKPTPENINHAEISGWPRDKPAQKQVAQRLALQSIFTPRPGRLLGS